MKKSFSMIIGALLLGFTACEDVPAPYGINWDGVETSTEGGVTLPYTSTSLSDFTTLAITEEYNPWSTGSNYTQATGYQKWDGSDAKSNKEVEGYLISPALNTTSATNLTISFDYCVGYANNDAAFAQHIKLFVSKDADVTEFNKDQWKELNWTATHTSTDWTLKTETISLPEEFVGVENVRVAFWFYAPAANSCTFELKNFKAVDINQTTGEGEGEGGSQLTPGSQGTKENPFSVAGIIDFTSKLAAGQETTDSYYIKGFVTSFKSGEEPGNSFGNATYYIADTKGGEPTFMVYRGMYFGGKKFTSADQLKVGDEVIIYSPVVNFKGNTPETVSGKAQIYSLNGKVEEVGGGDNPGPGPQTGEGLTITREGSTVTMTDSKATAGSTTVDFDFNTLESQGNATDVVEVTLSDGTTITFNKADNTNQPKYYTGTKGVRVYGGNSIVITGQKKIASITWTCDTTYTGADSMVATVDGNVVTIQNGATGNTQFRVQTIHIVYAN